MSTSTKANCHVSLATRVAQVAMDLALIIVWHVQTLVNFCKLMDHVHRHHRTTLVISALIGPFLRSLVVNPYKG